MAGVSGLVARVGGLVAEVKEGPRKAQGGPGRGKGTRKDPGRPREGPRRPQKPKAAATTLTSQPVSPPSRNARVGRESAYMVEKKIFIVSGLVTRGQ